MFASIFAQSQRMLPESWSEESVLLLLLVRLLNNQLILFLMEIFLIIFSEYLNTFQLKTLIVQIRAFYC